MKTLALSILSLGLLGAVSSQASAIGILLDAPSQSGVPGDTLVFRGVITNLDLENAVFLNSYDLNIVAPDLAVDGLDDFFNNVPISLDAGASSGLIELFTVTIANPTLDPLGTFFGTYTLKGGADGGAADILGFADFDVTETPEPGSLILLAGGMLTLVGRYVRVPRI